jgi:threonine dehydrogenase-like Zn-dependent dehydrogenase
MIAAQVIAPERFELVSIDRPSPFPGQVRVAVEGCGVCASNLPAWFGRPWFRYPLAPGELGHEGWGTAGQGCKRVIECTGHQGPLDLAGDLVAENGRLVIAGFHQDGLRQINLQQWNWKGIARLTGERARRGVLDEHSYHHRALAVEQALAAIDEEAHSRCA